MVLGFLGSIVGILRGQDRLALISLSILCWLFLEWIWFRWRIDIQLPQLKCCRKVNGSAKESGVLWTNRGYEVVLEITGSRGLSAIARIEDMLAENFEFVDGANSIFVTHNETSVKLTYTCQPRGVGTATLPGVAIYLTDPCGMFWHRHFLSCQQTFQVLTTFVDVDEIHPVNKRVNALPPPGIHRLQRAGMGSELLELREYVPGDPPKSIAWKVSARRDQLMTIQYESEVPVRTTLFIDSSISTRIGGFGARLFDQLAFTAASIARSALSSRDPVGMVLFDEHGSRRIESGQGERHFYRLLKEMTAISNRGGPPSASINNDMIDLAWQVASDQYPQWLSPSVNRVPFTWFPILPHSIRKWHRRFRLAAFLSELYNLELQSTLELALDDGRFATYIQKFLIDSGYAWLEPAIDRRGRGFHDCIAKLTPLKEAITKAVARGHDNELFVILIDLIDCTNEISTLIPAIRTALARHHRVAVICPTPDFRRPDSKNLSAELPAEERELLLRAEQLRLNEAADRLRRRLSQIGVPVTFAADQKSIRMVLAEADLARNGRVTHTRGRR